MSASESLSTTSPHRSLLGTYAASYPTVFAVLVTLAVGVIASSLALFMPRPIEEHPLAVLAYDGVRYIFAVGLLTALGWWGRCGFTKRPSARLLLPFMPWAMLPILQLLTVRLGTDDSVRILLIVESMIAAGFTEEALFRGVVLRALVHRGWLSAATISSILFALLHVTGLLVGADPLYIALQVIWAFLVGFSLAAPVLVTGWIWPAVILHFGVNVISTLGAGRLVQTETPDSAAIMSLMVAIVIFALLAAYGLWLLRRHSRETQVGD
jgi:uncharacterized protein